MTREEFFNKLEAGAKWDVGVSIARTNPLPLDANEIFKSIADMEAYIKTNALAYPGQIVVVLGTAETAAYLVNAVGGDGKGYSKLAATTGSGDVGEELTALAQRVSTIEGYFTAGKAKEAVKATQDGAGAVIADTYATKAALTQVEGDVANIEADVGELQTGLAGVKATADAAMPKAGGTFTGAVTVQAPTAEANPATKKYVDDAIGNITEFDFQIVTELPTTGVKGVIYLIAHDHGTGDGYDEYIWVTDKFEKIGNTDMNLSGYVTGTNLTAEKLVLGNGNSEVKASTYGVAATITATDEANLPTSKAVADYVATAKTEAIAAAGTNADTKIATAKTEVLGAVDTKLESYVTNEALDGKGYITKEVADLTNYTTTTDLNAALGLKADQATVDKLPTEDKVKQLIAAGVVAEANKTTCALTFGDKTFDGSVAQTLTLDDLGGVPAATVEKLGGLKLGYESTPTKRAVELDTTTNKAFVEIPAALTYAAKADGGLELTGNEFGIKAKGVTKEMIASVSTDSFVQGTEEFILNGGTATVAGK